MMIRPSRARITTWSTALDNTACTNVEQPVGNEERRMQFFMGVRDWWRALRHGCETTQQWSLSRATWQRGASSASLSAVDLHSVPKAYDSDATHKPTLSS